MPYAIVGHTADVRMRVTGTSREKLFEDALAGMMVFLDPKKAPSLTQSSRAIELYAQDAAALLVDFLSEALTLAHIHREWYPRVRFYELSDTALRAELAGIPIDAFGEDIKAVTYHEAKIQKNEKGEFETTIVFDI